MPDLTSLYLNVGTNAPETVQVYLEALRRAVSATGQSLHQMEAASPGLTKNIEQTIQKLEQLGHLRLGGTVAQLHELNAGLTQLAASAARTSGVRLTPEILRGSAYGGMLNTPFGQFGGQVPGAPGARAQPISSVIGPITRDIQAEYRKPVPAVDEAALQRSLTALSGISRSLTGIPAAASVLSTELRLAEQAARGMGDTKLATSLASMAATVDATAHRVDRANTQIIETDQKVINSDVELLNVMKGVGSAADFLSTQMSKLAAQEMRAAELMGQAAALRAQGAPPVPAQLVPGGRAYAQPTGTPVEMSRMIQQQMEQVTSKIAAQAAIGARQFEQTMATTLNQVRSLGQPVSRVGAAAPTALAPVRTEAQAVRAQARQAADDLRVVAGMSGTTASHAAEMRKQAKALADATGTVRANEGALVNSIKTLAAAPSVKEAEVAATQLLKASGAYASSLERLNLLVTASQAKLAQANAAGQLHLGGGPAAGGEAGREGFAAGFLPKGGIAQQVGSVARISLLYGTMYTALFGLAGALGSMVTSFSEFQVQVSELAEAAGISANEAEGMATNFAGIAAAFGVMSTEALKTAQQARGVFPNASEGQVGQAVRTASQLALVSGQKASDLGRALGGLSASFEQTTPAAFQLAADMALFLEATHGLPRGSLLQPAAEIAPLAAAGGFSQAELLTIITDASTKLSRTPQEIAASLTQIFARRDLIDLSALGVDPNGSMRDMLVQAGESFNGLSNEMQTAIAAQFGRGQSQQVAQTVLRDMPAIISEARKVEGEAPGKLAQAAVERTRPYNIGGQLQLLMANLQEFTNKLAQTGLLDLFGSLVLVGNQLLDVVNVLLGAFNTIPRPLRDLVAVALELALVFRLLKVAAVQQALSSAAGGIAGLFGRGAGAAAGTAAGAAAGTAAAGTAAGAAGGGFGALGATMVGGRALGAVAGIAGFATGIGGVIALGTAAVVAGRQLFIAGNEIDSAATSLRTGLANAGTSSQAMADAAKGAAEELKSKGWLTRQMGGGDIKQYENMAQYFEERAKREPPGAGGATGIETALITGGFVGLTDALSKLEEGGGDAQDSAYALADAVEALDKGLTLASLSAVEFGTAIGSLYAGAKFEPVIHTEYTTGPGGGPEQGALPIRSTLRFPEFGPAVQDKIDEVVAGIPEGLEPEKIPKYIAENLAPKLINPTEWAKATEEEQKELEDQLQTAFMKIPAAEGKLDFSKIGLDQILSLLDLSAGQAQEAIDAAAENVSSFNVTLTGNVANLKYSSKGLQDAFSKIGRLDSSAFTAGSKGETAVKELKTAQDLYAQALLKGVSGQELANAIKDMSAARSAASATLVEESLAVLGATYGDLQSNQLSKAQMETVAGELAQVAALASPGEIAKIMGSVSVGIRRLIIAQLKRAQEAAKVAADNARAEALALRSAAAFAGHFGVATVPGTTGTPAERAAANLKAAQLRAAADQADAAARAAGQAASAIAGQELGARQREADSKAKKDTAAEETDSAAAIAAAAALAEATRSGDKVRIATAELQRAQANLSDQKRGTVAYYDALAGVYKAQQDLASVIVEAASLHRQTSIDLTDQVAVSKEALKAAQEAFDSVKKQGLTGTAVDEAQINLARAQADAEAQAFRRLIDDVRTNEDLKRISHAQYIKTLEAERDRLQAIAHRTRQQQEQLNEVEGLLQAARDEMDKMFNLGDIRLPTVYEVRRLMQGGPEAMVAQVAPQRVPMPFPMGGADNRVVNLAVNIDGAQDPNAIADQVMAQAQLAAQDPTRMFGTRPSRLN